MKLCVLLAILLGLSYSVAAQRRARARFNGKGIVGDIEFTEEDDNNVRVVADLAGLQGNHIWHVHTLPVMHTLNPDVQCDSVWVGPHYDPFNRNMGNQTEYLARCAMDDSLCEAGDLSGKLGPLPINGQLDEVDTTGDLRLSGQFSIIGRAVVIHRHDNQANFECATVEWVPPDPADVVVLQASFVRPLAGTIYLRQVGGDEVQIWGKLYWTNDMDTTLDHNWHIHMNMPATFREGMCNTTDQDLGGHYDPTGNGPSSSYPPGQCTPERQSGCEIGDLTGKHDTITIAATPAPFATNAFFFTDSFLNLTRAIFPVVDRSIAVHIANRGAPVVACAPLVASEELTVRQYPNNYLSLSQLSPFERTEISTGNLPSNQLTVLDAAFTPNANCPAGDDSIYSPYIPFPGPGENTPDTYRLGDLANRYSSQLGDNRVFSVSDLPVYGTQVTLSNRPLRSISSTSRTCSALLPPLRQSNIILARAAFSGTVGGAIYFIQRDFGEGILGHTYIVVDIYYMDSNTPMTTGHNWHVHQNPPQSGSPCMGTIGGHYNPLEVSLGTGTEDMPSNFSNYAVDCSPLYPLRCELGDMSGKHGQLSIAARGENRPTFTYVDPNLHLTGTFTIIGRSIGLHTPEGPLFECAEIERVFLSEESVDVRVEAGDLRTSVMRALLPDDPSAVLVLRQEVGTSDDSVTFTVALLGSTQSESNMRRASVAGAIPQVVASLSLLLACLLLTLANF